MPDPALTSLIDAPFHTGERAAQARAGATPRAAAIRDWMPDQHRAFFAALPFVLATTTDADGWPVATILAGAPGFMASPDARTLRIKAVRDTQDPGAAWFKPGAAIGLLGIDLATRRRNRTNGVIVATRENTIVVAVEESFGNCPQYIHIRDIRAIPATSSAAELMHDLDGAARDAIAATDTLFVATTGGAEGVDISHRGGKPGFVRVDGDTLTIPDFAGNRYFNTLGNMLLDPRAALLIPDFNTGDVLHIPGRAEIVWDVPKGERLAGAERLWRLHVTRAWRRHAAVPLRWSLRMLSPGVVRTGSW
ncbi:MAG TPA: pyridoxamine 5'-phosphate oxidase family protein [Acetobacteraceae bacterium]|jgi:predicted pyridoxine 5'-phosphate oxidase superfamily flavin-nucleotide-binding protein|nr:pyridoxamine 5'-phosphate oxidase family protein [Acetobacteraceae bacterium]